MTGTRRGFAAMDRDKQREIARKGGANVPYEKRSFAKNRALAAEAGRKGGRSVAARDRSFSQDRELAAKAGRKGGRAAQGRRAGAGSAGGDFQEFDKGSRSLMAAEAAKNPTRFYARPSEVVTDERLTREEKLTILQAWELEARALAVAAEENMAGGEPDRLHQVVQARIKLGRTTTSAADKNGAPTKQGGIQRT